MVPLSFLWDGATLLIGTPSVSPTGRSLRAIGRVRLGIGPTRDVVLIEGTARAGTPEELTVRSATHSRPGPASTRRPGRTVGAPRSSGARRRREIRRGPSLALSPFLPRGLINTSTY